MKTLRLMLGTAVAVTGLAFASATDAATITDYWTGERLGRREGAMSIEMAPRSARLLEAMA